MVSLLESTMIRVGNEEYARDNASYGLTTLRNRHARVRGGELTFVFRGKSKIEHEVTVDDRRSRASSEGSRTCRASICSSTSMTTARIGPCCPRT